MLYAAPDLATGVLNPPMTVTTTSLGISDTVERFELTSLAVEEIPEEFSERNMK